VLQKLLVVLADNVYVFASIMVQYFMKRYMTNNMTKIAIYISLKCTLSSRVEGISCKTAFDSSKTAFPNNLFATIGIH
jgi:hypothetical protein